MGAILVVNAGSTSLKLSLVHEDESADRVESLDAVEAAGLDAVAHRVVHGGPYSRSPSSSTTRSAGRSTSSKTSRRCTTRPL
jgi:acetate kinase